MTFPRLPARLALPDLLRGVAILAMVIAHAQPFLPASPRPVAFVVSLISSMAAPLFALVMGMSAQLVWDHTKRARGRVFWRQGIKAVALIVLGVWMMSWGSWVAIVLQYLGVVLLIGVPLLLLPRITRLPIAAVLFFITPFVFTFLRGQANVLIQRPQTDSSHQVIVAQQQLYEVLGGGSYYWPTELIAFFLVGSLLVGVQLMRTNAIVILVASVVLFVPMQLLISTGNYSEPSWVDMGRDVAVVAFGCSVSVLVSAARGLSWLARVVGDIGRVSLTIYVVHVLFIAVYSGELLRHTGYSRPVDDVWWAWAVTVVVIPLAGMLWWRFIGIGPVEWVLNLLEGRPKHPRQAIRAARAERTVATNPTSD